MYQIAWLGSILRSSRPRALSSEKGAPMPSMFAYSPIAGRTQRSVSGKQGVSSNEQEAVDRADGRAHRLPQERSRKTPGSFYGDHIGSAQGGRGGPDAWLREVLR